MQGRQAATALAVGLTAVSGAVDALTFLRLGNVFSSVITGNLVMLGVSVGTHDATLAAHVGVAALGFVSGVVIGVALAGQPSRDRPLWPTRVTLALGVELVVLAGFLAGWTVVGGEPEGWRQLVLLAVAAVAMGIQSGATRAVGLSGLSTTYLTGTLTGVLADFVAERALRWRGVAMVVALVVGATTGALLLRAYAPAAPALPLTLLAVVTALASTRRFRTQTANP